MQTDVAGSVCPVRRWRSTICFAVSWVSFSINPRWRERVGVLDDSGYRDERGGAKMVGGGGANAYNPLLHVLLHHCAGRILDRVRLVYKYGRQKLQNT